MTPNFPPDATLLSIISAVARLASAQTSGVANYHLISGFVQNPGHVGPLGQICKTLLRGLVPAQTLGSSHTVVAFHGKFLSRRDEILWHEAAVREDDVSIQNLREQSLFTVAKKRGLRYCGACAGEDLDKYACPHWRIGHQLPWLHHCPVHRTPLLEVCAQCGSGFFSTPAALRLPCDPCTSCGCFEAACASGQAFPVPYWQFLELCRRALIDQAPELRPVARCAIVSRFNAHSKSLGQDADAVRDRFLSAWNSSTLQQFQDRFGSRVCETTFKHLLASGVSAAPNQFTAAVVSFAISHLPSDLLTEALRESQETECSSRPEGDLFSSRQPTLEEVLLAHAERTGYPLDLARNLAKGRPSNTVTRAGRASNAAQGRFMASLPEYARQAVLALQAAGKLKRQARPPSGTPEYAEWARKRALSVLSLGDKRRGSITKLALEYLAVHDGKWLDSHFPRRMGKPTEEIINVHRVAALRLKATGLTFRSELEAADRANYSWLRRHDLSWLKKEFQGGKSMKSEVAIRRKTALDLKAKGTNTRAQLFASSQATFCWLQRHDRDWLNTVFPGSKVFGLEAQRQKWRAVALALPIKGALRRRSDVFSSRSAYDWLVQNDRDWLDVTFPR